MDIKYQKWNWINALTFFKEVVDSGEGEAYFMDEDEVVHKVNIVEDKEVYEVELNGVNMGEAFDMGEMWETLHPILITQG